MRSSDQKIARPLQRLLTRQMAVPVIIKLRTSRIKMFTSFIKDFIPSLPPMPFSLHLKAIPTFNLVSAVLPSSFIIDIASSPDVERVYHDAPVMITRSRAPSPSTSSLLASMPPVVRQAERLSAPMGMKQRKVSFVTTLQTRKILLGREDFPYTGKNVKVGVIDTGVNRFHPQFIKKVRSVKARTVLAGQFTDENGHGTHVSTTICGKKAVDRYLSRKVGAKVVVEGMAPDAKLFSVKSLGYGIGMGSTSSVIKGLESCVKEGVDVINMSLGGDVVATRPEDDPFHDAFSSLPDTTIPVVAAGNSGPSRGSINSPGHLPSVITVGAYDPLTGKVAEFSSRGPTKWGDVKPDVIEPGVNIVSGTVGLLDVVDGVPNLYSPLSGTSMATPHLAGLVAVMKQMHRDLIGRELTKTEVRKVIESKGRKSNDRGHGTLTIVDYLKHASSTYNLSMEKFLK